MKSTRYLTIDRVRFIACTLLYCSVSLTLFLGAAFTGAAWIAYGFIVIPLYLACLGYCLSLSLTERDRQIGIGKSAIYALLGSQALTILTSPADCRGWHQGNSCYSFLQAHLQNTNALPTSTPHLTTIENLFPIALIAYVVAVVWSLKTLKIEDR